MNRLSHDEVHAVVPAAPAVVFGLVTDVTRTPEWSPEVVNCTWLEGATRAEVGARFAARNQRRWFRWTNKPVVTDVEPDCRFAFSRTERGGGTIEWTYQLRGDGTGTHLTLAYNVRQPVPRTLHVILRVLFGVTDLRADLHQNMQTSLDRLSRIAVEESAPIIASQRAGRPAGASPQ